MPADLLGQVFGAPAAAPKLIDDMFGPGAGDTVPPSEVRRRRRSIQDAAVGAAPPVDTIDDAARAAQGQDVARAPQARPTRLRSLEDAPPTVDPAIGIGTTQGLIDRRNYERGQRSIGRADQRQADIAAAAAEAQRQRLASDTGVTAADYDGSAPPISTQDLTPTGAPMFQSALPALIHSLGRSAVPTTGGVAAFGPGFAAGGALGLAAGGGTPAEAVTVPVGAVAGGLATSLGAGWILNSLQEKIFGANPDLAVALGQDPATRAADVAEHPLATTIGDYAPMALFMRPGGLGGVTAPEGAPLIQRVLSHPIGSRIVSGGLFGAQEAGRELATGEDFSPGKIAVALGAGALFNRQTELGEQVFNRGALGTARLAGRGYGLVRSVFGRDAAAAPDFENMASAGSSTTAEPVPAEVPQLPASVAAGSEHVAASRPTEPPIAPATPPGAVPPAAAPIAPAQPIAAPAPSEGTAGRLPDPGPLADGEHYVSTAQGDKVRTAFHVFDAASLEHASGDLQNRDRTRAASDNQVQSIIGSFDPARLVESPEADRGAPIVGPDNVIESGNGRVMALNKIYDAYPEQAQAYREFIESQGHHVPWNMERPILVRVRTSELDDAQRRQFVVDANRASTMELTPTERARSDADILDGHTLGLYRGGDIGAAGNRDFVRQFQSRLPASEQGALIDSNGALSQAGVKRVENALMARAYENPQIVEKLVESRDNNIRSIGGAMLDNSGPWASLRADVADGRIQPQFDVTNQLVEAARMVSDARNAGTKIADMLSQTGMFGDIDPVTEQFVRAFHNSTLTRAAGRDTISDVISAYLRRANEQTPGDRLFATEPQTPEAILRDIIAEGDGGDMFTSIAAEDKASLVAALGGKKARPSLRAAADGGGRVKLPILPAEPDTQGALDYNESGAAKDAGPYDPHFAQKAFTSRESIYDTAVAAMGYDRDAFRLLPGPRQIRLLAQAIKRTFGIEVNVKPGMQDRLAIDQMLDAYQNVQGMAYILGLAPEAIGLKGTLRLQLQKKAAWLGVFSPGANAIALPGRSNSFAHEWGHAFDWFLLNHLGDGGGRGFSGAIRGRGENMTDGKLAPSRNVREAFIDLLNTMFFERAALAGRIMGLEKQIATSTSAKVQATARAEIERIKAGASQMRGGRSGFYRGAQAMPGKADYWTSPTEMFARAFEAYVSNRAEVQGFSTEFIGKGDAAYLSEADDRFAKTFPHGEERDRIFAALDVVFQKVGADALLGNGTARRPDTVTSTRAEVNAPLKRLDNGNWFQRALGHEVGAIQDFMVRRAKRLADRPNNPRTLGQTLQDVNSFMTYGLVSRLNMIGRRYRSPTIRKLSLMLTHDSGSSDFAPRGLIQATRLRENSYINRIDRALERFGVRKVEDDFGGIYRKALTADEDRMLRDLLISEKVPGAPPSMVKLAAELRRMVDEIFYDLQRAGIDVGYARNGYLMRVLDTPKVLDDEAGFLAKAGEAYEIQFEREFDGDVLGDDKKLKALMKIASQLRAGGYGIDTKPLRALIKAANEGDDEAAGQIDGALAALLEEMKPAFAEASARAWLNAIGLAGVDEFDRMGPPAGFTQKRTLPPEADKILEDYYLSDPIEVTATYAQKAARRIEYATRFGADSSILNEMKAKMAGEGVRGSDIKAVQNIVDVATGNHLKQLEPSLNSALSFTRHFWGTVPLLGRAVISSLVESVTVGLVTSRPTDGIKALVHLVEGAFNTANARERREIARFIGIIDSAGGSHIMMNRFGGTYGNDTKWDRIAGKMFEKTGLSALTRGQKAHNIGAWHGFLDHLAGHIIDGKDAAKGTAAWARREDALARYKELGIRDPEAFAQQIRATGRLPSIDELAKGMIGEDAYAFDWTTAIDRLGDQAIQNPSAMDRPQLASTRAGAFIYGIQAFNYAFYRNIIKGTIKRMGGSYRRAGSGPGAAWNASKTSIGLLASVASLVLLQTIVSVAREYLLNRRRWEERKAAGTLDGDMIKLGLTRTFGTPMDPYLQAYSGLKYNRSLETVPVGPALGNMLQNAGAMASYFARNSPNTNTAEYNALRGMYNFGIGPTIGTALSAAPGGPILGGAQGTAAGYLTSPVAGDEFAAMFEGQKAIRHHATTGQPR